MLILLLGAVAPASAGVPGDPLADTTLKVSAIYIAVEGIAYTVSATFALIGLVRAVSKMANGDPEFKSSLLRWFAAAVAAFVLPTILNSFFR